jgi:cytoskeletal protein CcmA (bactofilin family)
MFGKEQDQSAPVVDTRTTSILAQGCKFKGEVEVQGTFRVEGEFEGTIKNPETLVVGKTGIIGGRVYGNIESENKVELQGGSHVEGDIKTRRLVIDEGVFFEGNCSMGSAEQRNAARAEKAAQSSGSADPKRHVAQQT